MYKKSLLTPTIRGRVLSSLTKNSIKVLSFATIIAVLGHAAVGADDEDMPGDDDQPSTLVDASGEIPEACGADEGEGAEADDGDVPGDQRPSILGDACGEIAEACGADEEGVEKATGVGNMINAVGGVLIEHALDLIPGPVMIVIPDDDIA